METTKKEKSFDAVKMMRDIRERVTAETQGMTAEQIRAYVKAELAKKKAKPVGT